MSFDLALKESLADGKPIERNNPLRHDEAFPSSEQPNVQCSEEYLDLDV